MAVTWEWGKSSAVSVAQIPVEVAMSRMWREGRRKIERGATKG